MTAIAGEPRVYTSRFRHEFAVSGTASKKTNKPRLGGAKSLATVIRQVACPGLKMLTVVSHMLFNTGEYRGRQVGVDGRRAENEAVWWPSPAGSDPEQDLRHHSSINQ